MVFAAAAGAMPDSQDEPESYEVVVFPRTKERDVYRRLGVSKEASPEEIQEARNYLVQEHRAHREGVEAIEDAFDKIIAQRFKARRKTGKINLKPVKEAPTQGWRVRLMQNVANPPQKLVLQRAFVYAFIAVWSLAQSAATGPAFQVAVAFCFTVYCMYEKRKNSGGEYIPMKSVVPSFASLFAGWLVGTIVPVYLSMLFPPALSPEAICALFSYVTMWWTATYWR